MAAMESAESVIRRGSRFLGAIGGFGCGFVLGGVLFALYSLTFASDLPENRESYQGTAALNSAHGLAAHYAWTAIVIGLVVLVAVALDVSEVARSDQWEMSKTNRVRTAVVLAVGAGVVVLPVMAVSGHLVRRYRDIRADVPLFPSLPVALTAAALVVAGSILLALPVWRSMIPLWREGVVEALSHRRGLGTAVAAGLAVSATLAAVAVVVADDTVTFDHTRAAATTIPSVPNRLGEERYRVPLPMISTSDYPRSPDVVVAGAGFVVSSTAGVTAYDGATGAPRWHYLSSSTRVGYIPTTLQSVDGGKVVVAFWDRVGWNAFDAMTGEILWHHADYTGDVAELERWTADSRETRSTPGYLIRRNSERIVRYDGRTGKRMWSADVSMTMDPSACYEQRISVAETDGAIYVLMPCTHADRARATVSEIDPATGTVVATREFEDANTTTLTRFENTVVIGWFRRTSGPDVTLTLTGPHQLAATVVDDSGRQARIVAADPDGTQQIRPVYRDDQDKDPYAVVAADTGATRYRLPGFVDPIVPDAQDIMFLRDEIVQMPGSPGSRTLTYELPVRSWSREDGHPVITRPVGTVNYQAFPRALAAPGAVLVFWSFESAGEIVGFGG